LVFFVFVFLLCVVYPSSASPLGLWFMKVFFVPDRVPFCVSESSRTFSTPFTSFSEAAAFVFFLAFLSAGWPLFCRGWMGTRFCCGLYLDGSRPRFLLTDVPLPSEILAKGKDLFPSRRSVTLLLTTGLYGGLPVPHPTPPRDTSIEQSRSPFFFFPNPRSILRS